VIDRIGEGMVGILGWGGGCCPSVYLAGVYRLVSTFTCLSRCGHLIYIATGQAFSSIDSLF
jgi:hypothetical protein